MVSSSSLSTRRLAALLLGAQLALSAGAGAQPRPARPKTPTPAPSASAASSPSAADSKRQGDEAMVALRYSDALDAYRAAYEQTHEPALLYNMARAFQGLERFPESLDHFERFKAQASPELLARVPKLDELIASVAARVSTLNLHTTVSGARVLLRGVEIGKTPLPPRRVNAGPARIEVLLEGYIPFDRQVELPAGATADIDAGLAARDRSGVLLVRSATPEARVQVDGGPPGVSPFEAVVDAGPHRIVVSRPGFVSIDTQVVIEAGARRELTLTLSREASVLSRWWFWTGVGVVVAGGAVLTYALLTEKEAGKGTIDPGRIKAPLTGGVSIGSF